MKSLVVLKWLISKKKVLSTLHFWKKMLIYNWTVEISLDICTHVCRTRRNEIICHLWKCFHIHEKLRYFLSWPPPVVQPAHLLCSSKPLSGIKAELYPDHHLPPVPCQRNKYYSLYLCVKDFLTCETFFITTCL